MEMCSEGSVYDLLCRPENFYGFPESQFAEFFKDFGKFLTPVVQDDRLGYWHQRADERHDNPPPRATRSYLWSKTMLEDPR